MDTAELSLESIDSPDRGPYTKTKARAIGQLEALGYQVTLEPLQQGG